jgi:hypothetical protein
MRQVILLVSLLFIVAPAMSAEDPVAHQHTTAPSNSRYELIQSSLAARLTFRLDKFTGRVWQMVKTSDDETAWQEMPVLGLVKTSTATRSHFQIFLSGIAVRHSFLIDTDTGTTWQAVVSKQKGADGSEYDQISWQPLAP